MGEQLTEEQVANWRRVLCGMLGGYALIMPAEQVQALRDRFQAQADALAAQEGE